MVDFAFPIIEPEITNKFEYQASVLSGGPVEWICNYLESNTSPPGKYWFELTTTTERVPASSQTVLEKWFTDSGWVLVSSETTSVIRVRLYEHEAIYSSSTSSRTVAQSTGNVTITCT